MANLALRILFARTRLREPLVTELAAEVVALRRPSLAWAVRAERMRHDRIRPQFALYCTGRKHTPAALRRLPAVA